MDRNSSFQSTVSLFSTTAASTSSKQQSSVYVSTPGVLSSSLAARSGASIWTREEIKMLVDSSKLSWTVTSLSVINTVLACFNLILLLVLMYSVYASSKKVIMFIKNYVRFYSQVLNPPEHLMDYADLVTESESKLSEPPITNSSNLSTDSIFNETETNPGRKSKTHHNCVSNSMNTPRNTPVVNLNLNRSSHSSQLMPVGAESRLTQNEKAKRRLSGSNLRSKIDKRLKNNSENRVAIERETSTESIRLKMKRSESWDAKNKVYLK